MGDSSNTELQQERVLQYGRCLLGQMGIQYKDTMRVWLELQRKKLKF